MIFCFLLQYLDNNSLLKRYHSGFRPGDFWVHQQLLTTYDTYNVSDANPSLEEVFS